MQGEVSFYCPDCNVEMKTVFKDGIMYHRCPECGYETVNNYNLAIKLWTEYLETINIISSAKKISYTVIRTLDYKRQVIHGKLIALYEKIIPKFDVDWFDDVCHSLDKYIDVAGDIDENAKIMASFIIRPRRETGVIE